MRSWFLVVLFVVAATGKVGRAEPPAQIPSRVGVDGVGGIGIYTLAGGSLRFESAATPSGALLLRAGHLQIRHIESETKEMYPVYFGHLGIRRYAGAIYFSAEVGAVAAGGYRGWEARPSGALTLGVKPRESIANLGVSLMGLAYGFSLGAHFGIDFAAW